MKLRLLLTIIFPALCSALGMEMRGMEQAKQFVSTAATLTGVATKSMWDLATKTEQEINLEKNTRILALTKELEIPGIKENGNVFFAALKDLGIDSDGYTYANKFVAETTQALQGTQDYNITHLLNLLSDGNTELTNKKTALFFITAFLRQPNSLEARKSLCEIFCNGCTKTALEHHNQLIGCYKKIFDYTGRNHTYFVLDYMRTIMVEAMRHSAKSRDLLRKTFVEFGDIKGPECLLEKTIATVDSEYTQAYGDEPKKNQSVALNNKRSQLYLNDIREIVSKNPSINLGNYWLSHCSSGAIQEELKRALSAWAYPDDHEKLPLELAWAHKIITHENGCYALKAMLSQEISLWKIIAQLDPKNDSELLRSIADLKERGRSWRDDDTQFILKPECVELAAQSIPNDSAILTALGDDFSAAVAKHPKASIAPTGDTKALPSKGKRKLTRHFDSKIASKAERLDELIEESNLSSGELQSYVEACEKYLEENKAKDPKEPKKHLEPNKEERRKKIHALMGKDKHVADLGFEIIDESPETPGVDEVISANLEIGTIMDDYDPYGSPKSEIPAVAATPAPGVPQVIEKKPTKKIMPPFIENASSKYLLGKWLEGTQGLGAIGYKEKFDGSYFTNAIANLREIAEDPQAAPYLKTKAEYCARDLVVNCHRIYAPSTLPRDKTIDQQNAGFIARILTEQNWKESDMAQAVLFDLIGVDGCRYYAIGNAASTNIKTLNFIQAFLTFKENSDPLAFELLKQPGISDIRSGKKQAELKQSAALKKVEASEAAAVVAEKPKVEDKVAGRVAGSAAEQNSEQTAQSFSVKSLQKHIDRLGDLKFAQELRQKIDRKLTLNNTQENKPITTAGMYQLEPEIPERKQATIGNGIHVRYSEQQKNSSWKPAIATVTVAGIGAACWWQWNTVKAFAAQHVPESVANIFARFPKASA